MKKIVPFLMLLFVAACGNERPGSMHPSSVPGEKTYTLSGVVISQDVRANTLTIKHGPIGDWMSAMTMPFPVRGEEVSNLPGPDARISAVVHVADNQYWITDVTEVEHAQPIEPVDTVGTEPTETSVAPPAGTTTEASTGPSGD